mgnify:CR=1 FL=1|tara:strand:- start:97114 stop:98079 length:966 start_codon:yes stop_codon:yes gene_type:complete
MKKFVLITSALFLVNCSQYAEPQGQSGRATTKQTVSDVNLEATFVSIKTNIIDKKCLSCHKADSKSDAKDIPFETEAQIVDGASDLGALVVPGRPAESLFYKSIVSDESIRGKAKVMPPKDSPHPSVTPSEQHVVAAWIAGVAVKKTEPVLEVKPTDQPADKAQQPAPSTMPAPTAVEPQPTPPTQGTVDPTINAMTPQGQIAVEPPPSAALPEVVDFALLKSEVLEKKCMICHKTDGKADELVFGTRDELLALTNSFGQSFVVVGQPEQSIMYMSVVKDENIRQDIRLMPPKKDVVAGKVTDVTLKDVALINKWIADGAK